MLQTHGAEVTSLADRRAALEAEMCSRKLMLFVQKTWSIIEPDRKFVSNWHLDVMAEELERAESIEDVYRAIENVPPGTMKTLLASVFFPAWVWAKKPSKRFLLLAYGSHRTIDAAGKIRRIVESDWYQEHYPVTLADDQNAKTRFNTNQGGWVIASSVGGVATGEHPDWIIVDDPLTEAQSRSDVERQEVNDWFSRTISSRGVGRGVKVLIVMQRLHQSDLSGYLLQQGSWSHICLPMEYEPSRPKTDKDAGHVADPRDPRLTVGELLWPSVFTPAKVRQLKLDLGPYGTAGQLQQRPAPEGGGLFKREWFKFVDVAPVVARRARGWDTAATEGAGDSTAGVKIAEKSGTFYIEDVVEQQVGPAGQNALILQVAKSDGVTCSQREEKEGGSAGKVVIEARLKALAGYDYAGVVISGDKVTRSKPFRAQVEGGNVCLVRGDWNEKYIRQLCEFPTGNHDDMVDGSSCAFNAVLLEPEPEEEWFAL